MYLNLMKVFFKENFSLKRILGTNVKSSKTKAILIIFAILYGFGTLFFVFGYMFFDLGKVLAESNEENMLLDFIFMYTTMLSILFIILRSNGYLFNYKDFTILQPLPIKTRTILLGKLTVMLGFIYVIMFSISAPIAFSYFYHGGFDLFKLLIMILLLLAVPIIPLVIFSFVSLLIARFSSRFRIGKALYLILMFVFFFGIMYLSMSMNMANSNPLSGQMGLLDFVSKYIPTGKWFSEGIHNLDILSIILMLVVSLALLLGFVFVIENLVIKTNQLSSYTRVHKSNKKAISKKRHIIVNIIDKEIKKFFNVPIYVFNSGFGPIILAVGGIAILFFKDDIMSFVNIFQAENISIEPIILVMVGFIVSTVFTSAISLSLEGKNFWILKSLPIKAENVMFGKMIFNVIVVLPFALFFLFMSGIALSLNFFNVILMMVYVTSLSFLSSAVGSVVNLHFPKFNFVNETEVVKQSLGAILGMFGTWLIVTINVVLYLVLPETLGFVLLVLINIFVNIALFSLVFYYIKNKSQVIFNKL
ncbi:MAG: hypothetical protein WC154_01005 [Candidatus Izemoplasmatales bacterium]